MLDLDVCLGFMALCPPPLISNTILWSPTGGKRILWNSGSESWADTCAGFNGNHHHQMEVACLDFIVASDAPQLGARVTKIKGKVNPFWHAGPYYSSERALFDGICRGMRNMSGFWENESQSHKLKLNWTHASENCSADSSFRSKVFRRQQLSN